jgi:hypothetical protein
MAAAFARGGLAQADRPRAILVAESVGHLVPRTAFEGRVHSVFAHACNLTCDDTLLTVCAFTAGNGPTTLRLARAAPNDLRDCFAVGERIDARRGPLRTRRVELAWLQASVWYPAESGSMLPPARIETQLRRARQRLDAWRAMRPNVLDTDAAPVIGALGDACCALDPVTALRLADRLIGWGEGLTPAGDDFLVGLLAGLGALVRDDELRRRFRSVLAAAIASRTRQTTPISAQCLRLACADHPAEVLVELRNALLGAADDRVVEAALGNALAVGSTSGADTVSGLLAGLGAWLPVRR